MYTDLLQNHIKNNNHIQVADLLRATNNQKDKDFAMYVAAVENKIDILKTVLDAGAGCIQNSAVAETIERAAELGHFGCVQLLTPLCGQKFIGRALEGAAGFGHVDILNHLLPFSSRSLNTEALKSAAHKGHTQCLEILIPLSDPPDENSEALNLAAIGGHADCVKLLIPVSDPTARNSQALQYAVSFEWKECVELLSPVSDVFVAFQQLRLSPSRRSGVIEKWEDYIHHYLTSEQRELLSSCVLHQGLVKPTARKI